MRLPGRWAMLVPFVLLVWSVETIAGSDAGRLHYLAVNGNGSALSAQKADDRINPASVVKVGTTLWALDSLGADHRWTTTFGIVGIWDRETGVLHGDLVVRGGGDPDFQWENAYLVARELNRLGLDRVEGRVRVQGVFWFGWEHGVETRAIEPKRRGERMGRRLVDALDPARWTDSHANTWQAMCDRRGWDASKRPQVVVTDGVRVSERGEATALVVHRSNELPRVLRRFNVYSNNDIVRVADGLGTIGDLETFVRGRLGPEGPAIELSTASGERRNRMTVRQMVRLVEELRVEAGERGVKIRELLPVVGCDPGSTRRMFPALAAPPLSGSVVCKTGTLTNTDGGVAVLAGVFSSPDKGLVTFAVAVPRAGGRLQHWRQVQQRWLMTLMDWQGGAVAEECGPELPFSDTFAQVESIVAGD